MEDLPVTFSVAVMRIFPDDTATTWAEEIGSLERFKKIQSIAPNWFVIHLARMENGAREVVASTCFISSADLKNRPDIAHDAVQKYVTTLPQLRDLMGQFDRIVINSIQVDARLMDKVWSDADAERVIGDVVAIELSANSGDKPI